MAALAGDKFETSEEGENALKEFIHDTTHSNMACDENGKCSRANEKIVINASDELIDPSQYEAKVTTHCKFDYEQTMVSD